MRVLAATALALAGAILAAGCASSHSSHRGARTASRVTLGSPRAQQIALARNTNGLFSIFPAKPGKKRCVIPEGGPHTTRLVGVCATSIRPAQTHEPELIVSFTERWIFACTPGELCPYRRPSQHTWRVLETEPIITTGARLRVAATQQSGSNAPQYYK